MEIKNIQKSRRLKFIASLTIVTSHRLIKNHENLFLTIFTNVTSHTADQFINLKKYFQRFG